MTEYDYLLILLGMLLVVIMVGFVISPSVVLGAAAIAVTICLYALFVVPPTG